MFLKPINIPEGTKVELLTITKKLRNKDGRSNYLCKCCCGNICEAKGKQLKAALENRRGSKKSCGCLVSMISRTHALTDEKDIVGQKFGRLTVLIRDFSKYAIDRHSSYWQCECECGNKKVISRKDLFGSVKSCGCLRKELNKKFLETYAIKKYYNLESLKKCSNCKKEKKCYDFFKKLDKFSSRCKTCYKEERLRNK